MCNHAYLLIVCILDMFTKSSSQDLTALWWVPMMCTHGVCVHRHGVGTYGDLWGQPRGATNCLAYPSPRMLWLGRSAAAA